MKSAFFIKRREALHFLRGLSSVFGKKSGGIFKKPDLKAAENKGWRIRETIYIIRRKATCEVFFDIPSDNMSESGGERA